jgi:hypothetical protein
LSPEDDGLPVLDHVQVAAPPGCEAQARRFYAELMGLPVTLDGSVGEKHRLAMLLSHNPLQTGHFRLRPKPS